MSALTEFNLDPRLLGLPTRDELVEMRIWDSHYHGFSQQEDVDPYFERMGIERVFQLGVGSERAGSPAIRDRLDKAFLEKVAQWKRVSPIVRIDPARVDESLFLIDRWIRNGPAIGIKYAGRNSENIDCAHPNNDPIIRAAAELGAVVYIHTWIKVGGNPRTYWGGGNENDQGEKVGESTPMAVAKLAARFPDVPLICGHSGGDWELGVRAIRDRKNVLFEFSGGDSWAGVGDMAYAELGADRLVWGSHAASRSFATELAKVYSSDMPKAAMKKALGTNLRRISAGVFARKGIKIDV